MSNNEIAHNLKCPSCGKRDRIGICIKTWALVLDDGSTDQDGPGIINHDHYWDRKSTASCLSCNHTGKVADFEIDPRELYEIRACIEVEGEVTSYSDEDEFNAAVMKLAGTKLFKRFWTIYKLKGDCFMAYGHDCVSKEIAERILNDLVDGGTYIEINVYPMINEEDGDSRVIEDRTENPDFYDLCVYERLTKTDEIFDDLDEIECDTLDAASAHVSKLEAKYPEASLEWLYS